MTKNDLRTSQLLKRVRDFGASRPTDFPPSSFGGQMFTEVATVVSELAHQAALQTASAGSALVGVAAKSLLRAALRKELRALNRAGRAIVANNPALKKKFRLPGPGDDRLLSTARAFAEVAEPLLAEFIKREMPADFLVTLKSDIDAFEAAVTERNHGIEKRVNARSALKSLIARGMRAVLQLDIIVKNKYAQDKPSLSAWESASHIERAAGGSTVDPTTDQGKRIPRNLLLRRRQPRSNNDSNSGTRECPRLKRGHSSSVNAQLIQRFGIR